MMAEIISKHASIVDITAEKSAKVLVPATHLKSAQPKGRCVGDMVKSATSVQ